MLLKVIVIRVQSQNLRPELITMTSYKEVLVLGKQAHTFSRIKKHLYTYLILKSM